MRRTTWENQVQGNFVSWLLGKSYDGKHLLKESKEQVLIVLYRRERRSDKSAFNIARKIKILEPPNDSF